MKKYSKLALTTTVVLLLTAVLLSTVSTANAKPAMMEGPPPTIQSCDMFGNPVDNFALGTVAWIKGSGFQPNSQVYIVVYDDGICSPGGDDHTGDLTWSEGQELFSADRDDKFLFRAILTGYTNSLGELEPTNVVNGVGPMYQCYDIVVKQGNPDDLRSWKYDPATDALDDNNACFHNTAGLFVVPEYTLGALMALIACFGAFFVVKHKSLHLPSIHR